jgi:molecular chaperone GrpE
MTEEDAVDIEIEDGDAADAGEEVSQASENGSAAAEGRPEGDAPIAERVAEHDEALAEAVRERIEALEGEREAAEERVDELESSLTRVQADFQNYKKRAKKRQEDIKARAAEDLVERLVPVRDNLVRALDQEDGADIRGGVESTLEELDRVLAEEDVETIEPSPGDEVDPQRHEVLMRVESDRPEETIAEVYRPGYELAEKVLREAQVTVSDGQ